MTSVMRDASLLSARPEADRPDTTDRARTRAARIVVAVVAAASLAFGVGVAASGPDEQWVDARHGWRTADNTVQSTEDGGRVWRRIFTGGTFVFGVVRTSVTAGLVSTGRTQASTFWTRDNGRHWYESSAIGGDVQGSGPYLYWHGFGAVLYRVAPWPPAGVVRCARWASSAFATTGVGAWSKRRNHCVGRATGALPRSSLVATLQSGRFVGLANVPGGVVAVVLRDAGPHAVLLVRRGLQQIVDLPPAPGIEPCAGYNQWPLVTWPRIVVLGCGPGPDPERAWISHDGGITWRFAAGP